MIQFREAGKQFGDKWALQALNMEMEPGSVWGILGPNGSGKTTLINLITGFLEPSCGLVTVDGLGTREHHAQIVRKIGAVLETPRLYPTFTAAQNLEYFCRVNQHPFSEIPRVLEEVELAYAANVPFNRMSLGMRQRLAIAVALLGNPPILIFDEPTNGLDPEGIIGIRNTILRLTERGATLLLCSHLIHEVQQICKNVLILKEGHKLASTPIAEFMRQDNLYHISAPDLNSLEAALQKITNARIEMKTDEQITIRLLDMDGATLNRVLMQSYGIALNRLERHERSLEDFFINAIHQGAE